MLESEKKGSEFSFWKIISYYKVCLKPSSRQFRTCLFLLLNIQGIKFFDSLYFYELVKRGFSRNNLGTLSFTLIGLIFFNFLYGYWTNALSKKTSFVVSLLLENLIHIYLVLAFPMQLWVLFLTTLTSIVFAGWRVYLANYMISNFEIHAFTSMFTSFMTSFSHLGSEKVLQSWICGLVGFEKCALAGAGLQLIIILVLPKFYDWVQEGDGSVPEEIREVS